MKNALVELFSDVDGLSPSEVMGFVAGLAGLVLAFLNNGQSATVLTFSAGCFGVNKAASAAVKTSQAKAVQAAIAGPPADKKPAPLQKGGPPV